MRTDRLAPLECFGLHRVEFVGEPQPELGREIITDNATIPSRIVSAVEGDVGGQGPEFKRRHDEEASSPFRMPVGARVFEIQACS